MFKKFDTVYIHPEIREATNAEKGVILKQWDVGTGNVYLVLHNTLTEPVEVASTYFIDSELSKEPWSSN